MTRIHLFSTTALLCIAAAGLSLPALAQGNMMVDGEWQRDVPDSAPPEPDLLSDDEDMDRNQNTDTDPDNDTGMDDTGSDLNEYDEFREPRDVDILGRETDGDDDDNDTNRNDNDMEDMDDENSQRRDADRDSQTRDSRDSQTVDSDDNTDTDHATPSDSVGQESDSVGQGSQPSVKQQ